MKKTRALTSVNSRFTNAGFARLTLASQILGSRILGVLTLLGLIAGIALLSAHRAQSAGGPIPVAVTNAPLATMAADNPAKQPVELQGFLNSQGTNVPVYTVPAGKRLVIEYVNVVSNVRNDPDAYSFILIHNNVFTNFSVVPDGSPYVAASQKVLLYADAGSEVSGFFQYSGSNPNTSIYYTITGYLVNVP